MFEADVIIIADGQRTYISTQGETGNEDFFNAFCALWLPFTLVNLAVALSVIIHD